MKRKMLSITITAVLVSSANVSANVFPNGFQPHVATNNCSIASDIIPAFCARSGAGSFRQAVEGCAGIYNMKAIYTGMLALYGGKNHSLAMACAATAKQHGGTVAGCIGQWTCYWNGGNSLDMNGQCDGNGQACASL